MVALSDLPERVLELEDALTALASRVSNVGDILREDAPPQQRSHPNGVLLLAMRCSALFKCRPSRASRGLAVALALFAVDCARPPPSPARADAPAPSRSNVLRGDYVGSAPCAECHAKEYDAWTRSPMHRMTRDGSATDVRAPFDGRALRFKGDVVALEAHGGRRFVRIARAGAPDELYRVTRVIGGRTREDFAGVRVRDASDAAAAEEVVLPVSYLISSGALRYKGYSVLVHERSYARTGPVWSQTCIFCHNTVPFFSTVLGDLGASGARAYQGSSVDRLLPAERRWTWSVSDARGLAVAAADEMDRLGARRPDTGERTEVIVRDTVSATREGFDAGDLVEVGIGCESCHGGARGHIDDPTTAPSFTPYAPFLRLEGAGATASPREHQRSAADARAQAIDRVCARCHEVLFSRYPWTWEGGKRQSAGPGGSPINSGEGRDFLLGGCASALACTACHDPHDARDRQARDLALATPAGNPVCTRCHAGLASSDALRGHAHHDPAGAGGACVACHMPQKNMGLDLALTRYHRIGSPTDQERVLLDRPLECALCHVNASVESLVLAMERWWKKAYARDLLARLYGDLSQPTLLATLDRGKPHERAVAAAVLGEHHQREAAPAIARELVNEYPLVRMFAARALAGALGKDCAIDVGGEEVERIEEDTRACLAAAGVSAPAFPPREREGRKRGDGEVPED